MKGIKLLFIAVLLLSATSGFACVNCNSELQVAIIKSYHDNTFAMFSAFIALGILVVFLSYKALQPQALALPENHGPFVCAALILGIGLGGFADGILLHQVMQWHEMLSNKISPDNLLHKSVNMFWDGIFHSFTLVITITGIYLLWKVLHHRTAKTTAFQLTGGMLAGWGIFNLIEGIINHQILELHNVREWTPNKELWNYGFLLFGILLIVTGYYMLRKDRKTIENL